MVNEKDQVDLGLSCADICRALDWGMNGKKLNDLCDVMSHWTTCVEPVMYISSPCTNCNSSLDIFPALMECIFNLWAALVSWALCGQISLLL